MSPLIAASLVVFFEVLSFGAIFPILTDYCKQLGAPPGAALMWTGIMFALVGGPRIFLNIYWGRLSDHWGRRRVLALITVGTMSGSILWAVSPDLPPLFYGGLLWLAFSRLFAGMFQAHAALTQAVAADVSTPEKRAAAMGHLGAAFGFGMLGGIILGGLVGHHISLAAVGWATAIGQFCSLMIILFAMKETHPAHAPDVDKDSDVFKRLPIRKLLSTSSVKHLLLIVLTMTAGQMILVPTLRAVTNTWYGFTIPESTWVFAVWMLIGVFVQGGMIRPMVKRYGERNLIIFGGLSLAGGFFLMSAHPGLGLFWTAAVLVAVGSGFATPTLTGLLSRNVSVADQGAIQGFNQSATALGRTVSYVLVAVVAAALPKQLEPQFWAGGGLVVLSLILLALKRPAPESPIQTTPAP